MSEVPTTGEHPRAHALRITAVLLTVWMLALGAAVGLLDGDSNASVLGIALMVTGLVGGFAWTSAQGPRPRGQGLSRAERVALAWAGFGSVVAVVLVVAGIAGGSRLSSAEATLAVGLSVACGAVALGSYVR
ncbi:MAG: hypothetical protein QOG63_782 [Thermoleophilaceae bacterium]|nr:hypothetical protein [Thermoleophilaceae bacterium]